MKRLRTILLIVTHCFLMLGLIGSAWGQSSLNLSLKGNFGKGEGESKAVFAAGSLVFYGLGNKVQIASFSNPANPVKIGSVILSDVVEGLVRTSIGGTQYIVASGGSKMWLINVQNPTAPSLVSTVDVAPGTTCEGIATSGSYAYVAAGDAGLRIYNIATPSAPTFVASIDSLAYCENVVIASPYAFIAADTPEFTGRSFIIDITDPTAPVYKSTIIGYGGYHQYMAVRSGYAFICDYNAGLQIINVADVTNPVNVAAIPSGYRTGGIVFDGNYAYVAVGDSGMKIYNVATPSSPVFVSRIGTTGRAAFVSYGAITIGGTPTGHIFVSNRNPAPGISAINVSVPATPTTSAYLGALAAASGTAFDPFYANGKIYLAYGSAGLRILDVTTPSQPTLLSTLPLGGDVREVVVSGNYAYVAARDSGVHVVDVTDPAAPFRVQSLQTIRARGVAISGGYVYVAASDSGMAVMDISTPASPSIVAYEHPGGMYGENVAVQGNVAGLTDYGKITFFDVSVPASPVAKGSTANFRVGNEGFTIAGNYAYVPDGDSLKIFDITDLMAPALLSKIKTGGYGYNAAIAGNYCYVASEATGVRAIDITNPASPVEAGYYDDVPQSRGVIANGGLVYVAEKADGLSVYQNNLVTAVDGRNSMMPEQTTLYQNFPNPFNPTTVITFELRSATHVRLEVQNVLGQTIAVLMDEKRQAGVTHVEFNADNRPSGVYFCRLITADATRIMRMTLVK